MGLSLHYSGTFRDTASLAKMVSEIEDIVEVYKWEYNIYKEEFANENESEVLNEENIYGISFTPPECETVFMCFLSNRKMSSPANLKFYSKLRDRAEQEYLYMLSVKTQFAGVEVHKVIIALFRYLKKQDYFENLKIIDEGEYWETGDEKLLQDNFKQNCDLIEDFSFAIENISVKDDEPYEKYLERIAHMISNKNRKKD
jgi:hypothetical protein